MLERKRKEMDNVLPETCLIEVEKERAGRLGKAEQRAVVVVMVGRRGNMTPVAAMDVEVAVVAISIVVRTNLCSSYLFTS